MQTVAAIFLILHGLVHAILALSPNPDSSETVFATFFSRSWRLPRLGLSDTAVKKAAILLAALATIGFIAAGLGLLDFLVPFDWWRSLVLISVAVSLILLLAFWHRYLIVGIAIDVAILITLLFTGWTPD